MWMDNIKMDIGDIGWHDTDWIDLVQDRNLFRALLNTVVNLRAPSNFGEFLSICTTGVFSKRVQFHEFS
jgi:hypothetical protein